MKLKTLFVIINLIISQSLFSQEDITGVYVFEADTVNTVTEYFKITYELKLDRKYSSEFIGCGTYSGICNHPGPWTKKGNELILTDDRDNLQYGKNRIFIILENGDLKIEKSNSIYKKN